MKKMIKHIALGLIFSLICKVSLMALNPPANTPVLTKQEIVEGVEALLKDPNFMKQVEEAKELSEIVEEAAQDAEAAVQAAEEEMEEMDEEEMQGMQE